MNSKHLLAISGLAIGIATAISVAPAGAVALNTGGVTISDGTLDFYTSGNPNSYTVTFNPGTGNVPAFSSGVSGLYVDFFPNPGQVFLTGNSTGTFNRVGTTETFSLASQLDFVFTNGVTLAFDPGSTFLRVNNTNVGVGFASQNITGRAINGADSVLFQSEAFTFQDAATAGGGGYSFTVSPTVIPEPFTIIGTLVGGTAAFRMRKRLIAAVNK
jgi:hypothetical protein